MLVIVAVFFWIAGCAAGRTISMGLAAFVPSVEQGGETLQGGTAGGTDGAGAGGSLIGVGGSQVDESGGQGSSGHGSDGSGVIVGNAGGSGANSGSGTGNSGHTEGSEGEGVHGGGHSGGNEGGSGEQGVNSGSGQDGSETKPGDVKGDTGANGNTDGGSGGGDQAGSGTEQPSPPPDKSAGNKYVALTFDDGPDTKYTTAILDILKEKGVKATFFVVGQQVSKYPEVLRRIADEGHAVGNHTENHKDLKKLGKAGILEQIGKTDQAVKEVLGEAPALFRAPYGSLSDTLTQVLRDQGRHHTGWTVDTEDWAGTSVADMRQMIIHDTKPNGIILMHSFGGKHIKNTVAMLPAVIDDLQELGYTLVTVDELP